jgi:hypothetical protein
MERFWHLADIDADDGARRATSNRLTGSYLAQEGAICRIVDGFVFEAPWSISAATSALCQKQT